MPRRPTILSRREALGGLTALVLAACKRSVPTADTDSDPPSGPALVEVLEVLGEDDQAVGQIEGVGLDGRLAYDHSGLVDPADLVTPNDAFFIRTREPTGFDSTGWMIELPDGPVSATDLADQSTDQGVVLLECSGNGANRHFGLISAARWSGVALTDLMAPAGDPWVEVTGYDVHPETSNHSDPGCSWIFRWSELSEAFLATGMNGEPLPPDHGAPVRLIVPGWYGCANPKWVQSVTVIDDENVAASSQMLEFASRTHQTPGAGLALEFGPAQAQASAMVVRIERYDDGTVRLYGLAWGARTGTLDLYVGDFHSPGVVTLTGPDETWEAWSVDLHEADLPTGAQPVFLEAEQGVPQIRLTERTYSRDFRF